MAKINLLPWREELRKQKKKEFLSAIVLGGLITILFFGFVHLYISDLKSHQDQRNKMLQAEIDVLNQKITTIKGIEEKKSKLLAKIELIKRLQKSRPEIVHLFDEIPKLLPDGIYLTQFTQMDSDLTFEGKSESNARVSAFMKAIEASKWLHSPKLDFVKAPDKATDDDKNSDFILRAKQGDKDDKQTQQPQMQGKFVAGKGGKR